MCKESKSQPIALGDQSVTTTLERLWLTYYNDTLYSKGLLTPLQYRKMKLMILARGRTKCSQS